MDTYIIYGPSRWSYSLAITLCNLTKSPKVSSSGLACQIVEQKKDMSQGFEYQFANLETTFLTNKPILRRVSSYEFVVIDIF